MWRRALAEMAAVVAPPSCWACAALCRADDRLCGACRRDLPWLRGSRCPRCAQPAPCGRCPAAGAAFTRAWAPLAYDGPARALVAALKFRGAVAIADLMAAQIAAGLPAGLRDGATLVPVPLHPARRRVRGFDQAALIAHALRRRTGLPLGRCLRRQGAAARQLGAGRSARLATGRLVLEVSGLAPSIALLVDDVHTTGATFDACARALRTAGAGEVRCVAYARTLAR